jgi:NtrC-family two-component system sensor histidine kinase KinB
MNRWSFAGGLTVTLLLLLMLSGFCVWATRGLTDEIGLIINESYDNVRAVREMQSAVTRLNAQCLAVKTIAELPDTTAIFRHEKEVVQKRISQVGQNAYTPQEREQVARLKALGQRYFAAYDDLFAVKPRADERFAALTQTITALTGDIGSVADEIVNQNESAMLASRDNAALKGRRVTIIVLGFAIFSLCIYVLTSMRLTQGVFEPLKRLRDSIQLVRDRRFDTVVPIEGTGELGQIAEAFNAMSRELQRYISETDERAVNASHMSRALLASLPYPIYIVDREFAVHQANPRAEELSRALGIPGALPGEVRRRIDVAAAKNQDLLDDDIRQALHLSPPGADYLPQVFRMSSALNSGDAWAVLLVDVTRLRHSDDSKRKALATLGHEVKTPVAGIRLSLDLLLEEKLGALNENQRELLQVGRDNCQRLMAVLQALLELARLEGGRTEFLGEPHDPGEILSEARTAHAGTMNQTGNELVLELPTSLPPVVADLRHAHRVLDNFISNAGKYGMRDKPVILRAQARADGYVRLSVINHGKPLSDEQQARVFEPFARLSQQDTEGTGLGLAICQEIATLHGGRVGVYSPPDADLIEFYFDLRCAT